MTAKNVLMPPKACVLGRVPPLAPSFATPLPIREGPALWGLPFTLNNSLCLMNYRKG